MRLKLLAVRNFRCHRDLRLDLSSDITVLYGRNGTGKTSVFDALELAFTGAVSRLGSKFNRQSKVALSNVHGSDDPVVRVEFDDQENHWIEITWSQDGKGQVAVQSDLSGPKKHNPLVFNHLLQKDFSPARRELRPIRTLFSSTVFLSQDHMRDFITVDSHDREQVLSTLAGSPDVQRRVNKARATLDLLRKKAGAIRIRLVEVEQEEEQIGERLSSLLTSESTAAAVLAELRRRAAEAGVPLPTDIAEHPRAFANHTRMLYEERTRNAHVLLEHIATLESMNQRKHDVDSKLNHAIEKLRSLTDRMRRLQSNAETEEKSNKKLQTSLEHATSEISLAERLQTHSQALLEELHDLQRSNDLGRAVDRRLSRLKRRLAESKESSEEIRVSLEQHVEIKRTGKREMAQLAGSLEALERNAELFEQSPTISAQIELLAKECNALSTRREELLGKRKELQGLLSVRSKRQDDLRRSIQREQTQSDARSKLISQFLVEIQDDTCPLCGHSHGSRDRLLEAIRLVGGRRFEELTQYQHEYDALLQDLASIEDTLAENAADLESTHRKSESLLAQRAQLMQTLEYTRKATSELGTDASAASIEMSISQMRERIAESQGRIAAAVAESENLEQALVHKQKAIAHATNSISLEEQRKARVLADLELCKDRIAKRKEETGAISDLESLKAVIESRTRTITVTSAHRKRVQCKLEDSNAKIHTLQQEMAALEAKLRDARESEDRSRAFLQEYEVLSRLVELDVPVDQEQIRELRCQTEQRRDSMKAVFQQAETYANVTQFEMLDRRRTILADQSAEIREELVSLHPAEQHLKRWIGVLEAAALDAVNVRITKFRDEINSLFRAMVAFPEKFDSVTVSDKTVQLGIIYRNVNGFKAEPKYYLSSAELNALALSVFLSLAVSQQCFRLQFILLDDPIQHLDDLDTVAFLDTVRCIATAQGIGRRQVLLSTCDRELYRLMVRKFSILNREKEGSFTAISLAESAEEALVAYDVGGPDRVSLIPHSAS